MKGIDAKVHEIQDERVVNEHIAGLGRGISQQRQMQFSLIAHNEDSVTHVHHDMHLVDNNKESGVNQKN